MEEQVGNEMNNTQIRDFTQGNISKQLVLFAWPLLLSNILQVVYNMVDMIIVGNVIGKVGTSAVTVGGDVTNLLTFVGIGFALGFVDEREYKAESDRLWRVVAELSSQMSRGGVKFGNNKDMGC